MSEELVVREEMAARRELTPLETAVFERPQGRQLVVELCDPLGQPILVASVHGGPFTFPAMMDARDIAEFKVPFTLPGLPPAALPWFFRLRLAPETRVDRAGIEVRDNGVG